ncbi:MAG: hypothetical protein WCG66_06260 [bacterium]
MKPALLLAVLAIATLPACTTIQNRRDLYFPQTVEGPYTRMLKDGTWRKKKTPVTGETPASPAGGHGIPDSKQVRVPIAG